MNTAEENISIELTLKEVGHILFCLVDISEEFDTIDPKKSEGLSEKAVLSLCERVGVFMDEMENLDGTIKKHQTSVSLARANVKDIVKCLALSIIRFDELGDDLTEGYTKEGLVAVATKLMAKVAT